MLDRVFDLLEERVLTLMDTAPIATVIHVSTTGNWNMEDFTILWANQKSIEMLGHTMGTGSIQPTCDANRNAIQATLDTLRCAPRGVNEGFVRPTTITTTTAQGERKRIDYSLMHIGNIAAGLPVIIQYSCELDPCLNMPLIRAQDQENPMLKRLTQRERRIAIGICRGATNRLLASELKVSEQVIKIHRAGIRRKLEINDRQTSIIDCIRQANPHCISPTDLKTEVKH